MESELKPDAVGTPEDDFEQGVETCIQQHQERTQRMKPRSKEDEEEDRNFERMERRLKISKIEAEIRQQNAASKSLAVENCLNIGLSLGLGTLTLLGVVLGVQGLRPPKK